MHSKREGGGLLQFNLRSVPACRVFEVDKPVPIEVVHKKWYSRNL